MAGTVAQDLWDRCLPLSRMSERKNVSSGTSTALSMQQSTGVIQMIPLSTVQTIFSVPCENHSLCRHGPLLPKITHPRSSRSSTVLFVEILNPVTNPYRYKRPNKTLVHLLIDRKNKEDLIESP